MLNYNFPLSPPFFVGIFNSDTQVKMEFWDTESTSIEGSTNNAISFSALAPTAKYNQRHQRTTICNTIRNSDGRSDKRWPLDISPPPTRLQLDLPSPQPLAVTSPFGYQSPSEGIACANRPCSDAAPVRFRPGAIVSTPSQPGFGRSGALVAPPAVLRWIAAPFC